MSQLLTQARRNYAVQRNVSQGSGITLLATSGGYAARFECAKRCAEILGERNYSDHGHPVFFIPTEQLFRLLTKLSETQSIALLDTVTNDNGTSFVLVWKIPARAPVKAPVEVNLDEY